MKDEPIKLLLPAASELVAVTSIAEALEPCTAPAFGNMFRDAVKDSQGRSRCVSGKTHNHSIETGEAVFYPCEACSGTGYKCGKAWTDAQLHMFKVIESVRALCADESIFDTVLIMRALERVVFFAARGARSGHDVPTDAEYAKIYLDNAEMIALSSAVGVPSDD